MYYGQCIRFSRGGICVIDMSIDLAEVAYML